MYKSTGLLLIRERGGSGGRAGRLSACLPAKSTPRPGNWTLVDQEARLSRRPVASPRRAVPCRAAPSHASLNYGRGRGSIQDACLLPKRETLPRRTQGRRRTGGGEATGRGGRGRICKKVVLSLKEELLLLSSLVRQEASVGKKRTCAGGKRRRQCQAGKQRREMRRRHFGAARRETKELGRGGCGRKEPSFS